MGRGGMFLFPEHAVAQQIFLGFIIGSMVMGAVSFLSPVYQSYLLFNLTGELPYIFYLSTYSEKLHILLGISHILFGVSMLMAAKSTQNSFLQNLMLRLVNQELVSQLNGTNKELENKIELKNKIEQDLRENEYRFKDLSNASHDGVLLHKDGIIIDANETVANMLGYVTKELIGMNALQVCAPECYDDIVTRLTHQSDASFDVLGLRKDGTTFKAELSGGDISYQGERVRIVSIRDISRQKQIEADLLRAKNTAEGADRLKSEFIASVSHELRTPLNAIIGFMGILGETKLTDEQSEYLNMGGKSAEQLLVLINDLLDLSRIESGHFEYDLQPVELKQELNEMVQVMSVRARENNNQLHLELSDDLPSWVNVDPK